MEELRNAWDGASSFAEGTVCEKWWCTVMKNYSEEGRIYHNHTYLKQLLEIHNKYQDKLANPQAVILAIFFHKLEYNPQCSDTDAKNLERFNEFMREAGEGQEDSSVASSVRTLLEASVSNLTDAHMTPGASGTEDTHYFLDFTTAVLGTSEYNYNTYTTKIQAEYSHLTTSAYNALRVKMLKNLLLMPNIYATSEFQAEREKNARENIQKEIDTLQG